MKNLILQKSLFYKISTMLVLAVITVSCGSYQSVSYNDGIYSDDENNNASLNQNIQQDNEVIYEDGSSAYYESLFKQGAESHGNNFQQEEVFTDVESYSSTGYDESDPNYTASYGGGEPGWEQTLLK